jgi:hypothetical protein
MLDYLQAGVIRRKYPETLSRQNIDDIIEEWDDAGIEQVDMLYFSSMFDPKSHKLNISEMKLTLKGHSYFHFKDLKPCGTRKFYGMLGVMHFENLTGYQNPYEVEKETYNLRLTVGREWLDKCEALDARELSDAFKEMREIRKETRVKYPYPKSRWESKLDKLVDEYIEPIS